MSTPNSPQLRPDDWKPVNIDLPARYWIPLLGIIDSFISTHGAELMSDAKKKGFTEKTLPDSTKAILAGTMSARAAIVTALANAGVMTPEADKRAGVPALRALLAEGEKWRNRNWN